MMDKFNISEKSLNMLSELESMDENDIEWLRDMSFGIASIMYDIREKIENPPEKDPEKENDCQVIHLGSELFLPIKKLKKKLERGLTLEDYIRNLDDIVCKLEEVIDKNYGVMYNPKVCSHMRDITNNVVVILEAGGILNLLMEKLDIKESDYDE